jgi:hypothetical protein
MLVCVTRATVTIDLTFAINAVATRPFVTRTFKWFTHPAAARVPIASGVRAFILHHVGNTWFAIVWFSDTVADSTLVSVAKAFTHDAAPAPIAIIWAAVVLRVYVRQNYVLSIGTVITFSLVLRVNCWLHPCTCNVAQCCSGGGTSRGIHFGTLSNNAANEI